MRGQYSTSQPHRLIVIYFGFAGTRKNPTMLPILSCELDVLHSHNRIGRRFAVYAPAVDGDRNENRIGHRTLPDRGNRVC